jgi:transcriptional regulator with XRE-family HTH domain
MPPAKPPPYIPSVRARRLARSLREAREQAGLGVSAAAAQLGWSQGKVSHIESGRNKPAEHDVELMLDTYGVTTPERDALLALAREAERRGWWTDFVDVLNGPYVALEDAASEICDWSPQLVPGLLQTPEYAREVIRAGRPDDPEDVERRIRARVQRQMLLSRDKEPPYLHAILDEAILHRPLGGVEVMRDQLFKLAGDTTRHNVSIQILPWSAGTHAGLEGQLIMLRFAELSDPDVAYVEGFHGAVYLESPRKVAQCNVAFQRLREAALSTDESAALIRDAAKRL